MLSGEELAAYRALIQRRRRREPVAYIRGEREFYGLSIRVDPRVLVPRPDTETLVEVVLQRMPGLGAAAPRIVDVGTGSGAIAIAIAVARPDAQVEAVDRSPDAAEVARANAARHAPAVNVLVGDLLAPIDGAIDVIVSNPPYIPTAQIATLQAEVQREPRLALDGGPDGLEVVRRLVSEAHARLVKGGLLALEIGDDQAEATAAIFAHAGFDEIAKDRDLAGTERVVSGKKR
jgi:release factor glutamine methyltransferase